MSDITEVEIIRYLVAKGFRVKPIDGRIEVYAPNPVDLHEALEGLNWHAATRYQRGLAVAGEFTLVPLPGVSDTDPERDEDGEVSPFEPDGEGGIQYRETATDEFAYNATVIKTFRSEISVLLAGTRVYAKPRIPGREYGVFTPEGNFQSVPVEYIQLDWERYSTPGRMVTDDDLRYHVERLTADGRYDVDAIVAEIVRRLGRIDLSSEIWGGKGGDLVWEVIWENELPEPELVEPEPEPHPERVAACVTLFRSTRGNVGAERDASYAMLMLGATHPELNAARIQVWGRPAEEPEPEEGGTRQRIATLEERVAHLEAVRDELRYRSREAGIDPDAVEDLVNYQRSKRATS
jgi:hypothetical protein